jgi:1,2-diacylglycerol 3-alpha-glucosyltransferase
MVPPEEVARYYALGDIFVSASQSETQGLTYIEAMAAGLPPLCRDDPCLAEVVRDGENGFLYRSAEEFDAKLRRLAQDISFRRTLGTAARETAFGQFSARRFAENVLAAYASLLDIARRKEPSAA